VQGFKSTKVFILGGTGVLAYGLHSSTYL